MIERAFKECSEFMVSMPGVKITNGSMEEELTLQGKCSLIYKEYNAFLDTKTRNNNNKYWTNNKK